jgi:hypothetical protein
MSSSKGVLGVMHDKERGVKKRKRCRNDGKRCSQEECGNLVVQGGVCVKHGAIVKVRHCSQDGCCRQV